MKIVKITILTIVISFIAFTLGGRLFGVRHSVVLTSSMHPAIPKHSLVYIKDIKADEVLSTINEGDVVAVDVGSAYPRLHRVKIINGNLVTTKGDHNDTADDAVTSDKVIGIVILSIPVIGVLFNSVYPWIILLLVVLMYYGIKYIIKELKKR